MVNQKSLANLRPFKKGENGKTPPKAGERITDVVRSMLDKPCPTRKGKTYKQAIAATLLERAIDGDTSMLRELLDRLEGKVIQTQALDVTTKGKALNDSRDIPVSVIDEALEILDKYAGPSPDNRDNGEAEA